MKPILISRQTLASTAAERWYYQYSSKRWGRDTKTQSTLVQLRALGPTPSPEDVDRIVGNSSWTSERCNACGDNDGPWVQVGEEEEAYQPGTAVLCKPCAVEAASVFESTIDHGEPGDSEEVR
jgi:hypothetical protein